MNSMKKSLYLLTLICISICIGCSSDDNDKNKCESCTGTNIAYELCDNGNGIYTLSKGEVSQTLTDADLLGISIKEYVNILCTEGN